MLHLQNNRLLKPVTNTKFGYYLRRCYIYSPEKEIDMSFNY